jgi:HEAT repeats
MRSASRNTNLNAAVNAVAKTNFAGLHFAIAGALSAAFSIGAAPAGADVFELTSGGRIEGQLIEAVEDDDGAKYTIELAAGGRVTLAKSQVARVDTTTDTEAEYEKLARSTPDTADGHWRMVEWCREKKLTAQTKAHLTRILELDPNHAAARNASGFRQENGEWLNRDDVMTSRGMVMYEGRYVTPQHVELLERQKQDKDSQANWSKEIDRLRRWLTGRRPERIVQAQDELKAIRDPAAAEAVVDALKRERDPGLKRVWIAVAAQIDHRMTIDALVDRSLSDPEEEIRYMSLEYLVRSGRPGLATPYVRALKNRDNEIMNRAGAALGQIGDRDALGPLIEALITTHKIKVSESNPDQHAYTFTPESGAFSFGGSGPKVVQQDVRNPAVLNSLVTLSGGTSFDYDQAGWRRWLAAQAKNRAIDIRRDE